jgi:hypothetical protein
MFFRFSGWVVQNPLDPGEIEPELSIANDSAQSLKLLLTIPTITGRRTCQRRQQAYVVIVSERPNAHA